MMEKDSERSLRLSFSLNSFVKLCLRSWRIFVITIVVFMLLAGLYLYKRIPTVEVDAQVMLPQESATSSLMAEMSRSFSFGDILGSSSSIDNEMDVMRSFTVFLNTARQLGLNVMVSEREYPLRAVPVHTKSPLTVKCDPSIPDTLGAGVQFKLVRNDNGTVDIAVKYRKKNVAKLENVALPAAVKTPVGTFDIEPTQYWKTTRASKFIIRYTSYAAAAETYAKKVSIFIPNKKTDFIGLSYNTVDPEFGELLLNTIIQNYNRIGFGQRNDKNNRTLEFVNRRLASLTDELAASESNLEQFKRDNELTDPEMDAGILLQKSSNIEALLLQAQTENEILAMTRRFINNPENNYSIIPSLATDGAMSASYSTAATEIGAYNQLILERMKMLNSAKANNVALKAITQQIDALRSSIITSVDRAYENSNLKLSEISRENDLTSSRKGTIPALERQYLNIKRVQLVQEQLYLFLLKQREEINMSQAHNTDSVVVIDAPHTMATATTLGTIVILFLAMVLGALVSMLIVFLKHYNNAVVRTLQDVNNICKAPVAVAVPNAPAGFNVMSLDSDGSTAAAEAIRALRQEIRSLLVEAGSNTVMVASARPGEGRTFTACNLAEAFALLGRKVALVEADMRHPEMAAYLGVTPASLLNEALQGHGTATPTRIALPRGCSLDLFAAAPCNAAPELIDSQAFADFIDRVKADYDYVIIDTPPVAVYTDAFAVAPHAAITAFTVRCDHTTGNDLMLINSLYNDGRLPRILVVADGFDHPNSITTMAYA